MGGSIGSELISNQPTSNQDNNTTSNIVVDTGLRKKRDFFNGTTASMQTELDNQKIMDEVSAVSPKSETGATNAHSRSSGFMITDILSNANRGQAAAAAAAAALQSRLQGPGGMLGLHPGLTEFHLQQQIQQFHAHQQQQQQQNHEASSDDGEAMSDDETTSSKDAYDQEEHHSKDGSSGVAGGSATAASRAAAESNARKQ